MNTNSASVVHPLKYAFDIESYNSMWYDNQPPSMKPSLNVIFQDSSPSTVEATTSTPDIHTLRPDTVKEMDTAPKKNLHIDAGIDAIVTEEQTMDFPSTSFLELHQKIVESKGKLFFITYSLANTLRHRWYSVQVDLKESEKSELTGKYDIKCLRCHPKYEHKPDDKERFWPDWYKMVF